MQTIQPEEKRGSLATKAFIVLSLAYFVLLGCVIAYIWLIAQDRFVTTASFKISRQNPGGAEVGLAGIALPGLSDSGSADSQLAIGFINSSDLLLDLEKKFDLRNHYASPPEDFVFRLKPDAQLETRLEYYRKRIFAHFDKESGLTMLTVDSFDPQLSQRVADALLKKVQTYINIVNQSIADQQLSFIRAETERAENHVLDLSKRLLDLQNENQLIRPDEAITASLTTIQTLKMERIQAEIALTSLERDSPGSPRIDNIRSQLRTINEQIAVEAAKLSGPERTNLNQVLARFKDLELRLDFAIQRRTGTETLLEKNRMDAAATSRFLSIVQKPYLPEEAAYPQRWYATITIFVLGILLFLILRILIQSVYERRA